MSRIERRRAAAPGTAPGGPRSPRRSKEDVSVDAGRPREVGASCAPADERDAHVQPILEEVASREPDMSPRRQDPCQDSLGHQGMALPSRWDIDSA
jgi:hypothetical protein